MTACSRARRHNARSTGKVSKHWIIKDCLFQQDWMVGTRRAVGSHGRILSDGLKNCETEAAQNEANASGVEEMTGPWDSTPGPRSN